VIIDAKRINVHHDKNDVVSSSGDGRHLLYNAPPCACSVPFERVSTRCGANHTPAVRPVLRHPFPPRLATWHWSCFLGQARVRYVSGATSDTVGCSSDLGKTPRRPVPPTRLVPRLPPWPADLGLARVARCCPRSVLAQCALQQRENGGRVCIIPSPLQACRAQQNQG
jgi:hypothetical protein